MEYLLLGRAGISTITEKGLLSTAVLSVPAAQQGRVQIAARANSNETPEPQCSSRGSNPECFVLSRNYDPSLKSLNTKTWFLAG